jgi:hypothetical protein
MRITAMLGGLLLVMWSLVFQACEAPRDSYKLSIVFTTDCKGYLEDCG